ncbi:hypothetical protein A1Q1_01698 [Trichosporon asahii var. asahii CBS 2479]|uniref:Ubiquitin-like domain-containing protein n=1 Tax=Trichosporon asahii var. asahii (strain ATCC 90039 / CBS 2479 / JCM 2466 / KCTC 7840 / NBRC 103889/ NCYC 2677 / UAMH 7654) TaxID=1186058 RepID=J6F205_TRIAS|nr:hypothetical protein A1Q1_01698 [Trichosporon asahii var. asahii CBS 2479]EJT49217.1 hypothetical protein A1Q1_01698 [Trichosporon asahii var. asahii CBS 2479]
MAPLIPPNQPIDPMRIPIRVCAALATVPAPPVTCYITRSSEMIKLKSLSLSEASANRRLLYNGERVRHDDTLETLGIEDDDIRGGVTFELMAEHSADEGEKRGSCPCIFLSDHPLRRFKVQRSGRLLIRTDPQHENPAAINHLFLPLCRHSFEQHPHSNYALDSQRQGDHFLIDGETLSRESSLASLGFSDQKIKTGITIEVLIEQAGG